MLKKYLNIYQELENRLLWVPIFIGFGILLCFQIHINISAPILACLIIILALSLFYIRCYTFLYCIFAAFLSFLIGCFSAIIRIENTFTPYIQYPINDTIVIGKIEKIEQRANGSRIYLYDIELDNIKILERAKEIQLSEKFEGLVNKLRAKIVEILSKDMDKSASAIAAGLLVGDASGISDDDFKALRISGKLI